MELQANQVFSKSWGSNFLIKKLFRKSVWVEIPSNCLPIPTTIPKNTATSWIVCRGNKILSIVLERKDTLKHVDWRWAALWYKIVGKLYSERFHPARGCTHSLMTTLLCLHSIFGTISKKCFNLLSIFFKQKISHIILISDLSPVQEIWQNSETASAHGYDGTGPELSDSPQSPPFPHVSHTLAQLVFLSCFHRSCRPLSQPVESSLLADWRVKEIMDMWVCMCYTSF